MASNLRLSFIGKVEIDLDGVDLTAVLPVKMQALLAYLVMNEGDVSRPYLAELLWGGGDAGALRNLRVNLSKIKKSLGTYLHPTNSTISFARQNPYDLDVENFEYALSRAANAVGAERRAFLREAVALYRGDFLADLPIEGELIYDEWVMLVQERLRRQMLEALDMLVDVCLELGDNKSGIQYAQQLLGLENWREKSHRQLMQFFAANGQKAQALNQFEECRRMLAEEFGEEPTAVTLAVYERIQQMAEGQRLEVVLPRTKADTAVPFLAPIKVPHFTGRDDELDALGDELLRRHTRRVIALVGLGGVGKTSLATMLAHDIRKAFPDGVLWANAATTDPMTLAERWANAYGYNFSQIPDWEERAAVLRDILAKKQALIIFDDVTAPAWVRHFIPPGDLCAVLLTTRNADHAFVLQAQVVEVGVLNLENGRALLSEIVGEERVQAEAEAAAEIYDLLAGLPLALTIAAQQLAIRRRRPLSWLLARLRHEKERIGLKGRAGAVRASFAFSWQSLDAAHQQIYTRLAVFSGRDFPVAAAAAVAEMEPFPTQDRLDMLARLSLLNELEGERYRQHPLLADFAREKLGEDDVPYRLFVAHYLTFARDHSDNYAALAPEWENLAAGIEQAHRLELWQTVIDYSETLRDPWFMRGRYHEARSAFRRAAVAAETLADQKALAQCLLDWGYVCYEQGDWDEAQELLTRSLNLFQGMNDLAGLAAVQTKLAWVMCYKTEFDEAERLLAASQKVFEQLGDKARTAETIYIQGHVRHARGDYANGNRLYEQALVLQEEVNDQLGILRTLRSLAQVAINLDQEPAQIKQYVQRAAELADEMQDQVEKSLILRQQFRIFWREGDKEKAEEFALKSLELHRNLGDRRGQAMAFYLLCEFKQGQEEFAEALEYGQESLKICRGMNDLPGTAYSLQRLGDLYACLNQYQQACLAWTEGIEIAQRFQHKTLLQEFSERLKDCPSIDH